MNMSVGEICHGEFESCTLSVDDYLSSASYSSTSAELCDQYFAAWTQHFEVAGNIFCQADWNIASCWPPARAGELAIVPCFNEFRGTLYSYKVNATASRQCFDNGTWDTWNNYSECLSHSQIVTDEQSDHLTAGATINLLCTILHYFGYALSSASCLLAICIYAKFPALCRLRNLIHLNLITTYILTAASWVVMNNQFSEDRPELTGLLRAMIVAFTYAQVTTFFWALCEGIYMTCILFRPHKLEQLSYWPFAVIGWVVPGVIIMVWSIIKVIYDYHGDWLKVLSHPINYIFMAPVFLVLAVNLIFSFIALNTILRKQSNQVRHHQSSTVGRGVRSFLILLPLLGLSYVMILVQPTKPEIAKATFQVVNSILLPAQGFFVAVMYCFCNRQVRGILKFYCYRKLSRCGFYGPRGTPETVNNNDEISSAAAPRHFDIRSFKGNRNELQYILKTKKQFQRAIDTESLRLSRLSSRKFPVHVV